MIHLERLIDTFGAIQLIHLERLIDIKVAIQLIHLERLIDTFGAIEKASAKTPADNRTPGMPPGRELQKELRKGATKRSYEKLFLGSYKTIAKRIYIFTTITKF